MEMERQSTEGERMHEPISNASPSKAAGSDGIPYFTLDSKLFKYLGLKL